MYEVHDSNMFSQFKGRSLNRPTVPLELSNHRFRCLVGKTAPGHGSAPWEWQTTFGSNYSEQGHYAKQNANGGYTVSGFTESIGQGFYDIWADLHQHHRIEIRCGLGQVV